MGFSWKHHSAGDGLWKKLFSKPASVVGGFGEQIKSRRGKNDDLIVNMYTVINISYLPGNELGLLLLC